MDLCPEWKKPSVAAQYYGSANRGLGSFYIDVEPKGNRFKHWNGLDNFGLLKIEEGVIDENVILQNLKELFDENCPWRLKKTGEGKYIIRFPPDKKSGETSNSKNHPNLSQQGCCGGLSKCLEWRY